MTREPRTIPIDTGLTLEELDPARPRLVETPFGSFALYLVGQLPGGERRLGNVRAWQAFCPHMQGPLHAGSVAGGVVTCPWHGWSFSLDTGECTRPEEGRSLPPLVEAEVGRSEGGTLMLSVRRPAG